MSVQRVSHHLLLCATPTKAKCCDPNTGLATWNELKRLIKELGLENSDRPEGVVLRSKVDCLRICDKGPILVVWPDGIWYTGHEDRSLVADSQAVNLASENNAFRTVAVLKP